MDTHVLTSVITVSYHTGPVLDQAITAVLASKLPVELVLVNNGNPPEVEAKLKEMAAKEPRLRLITGHGNVGFGTACNLGAKVAKGSFFLFLNPDSILPPDAIEKLYAEEAKLKPPFMLGARLQDANGKDQRGSRRALLTPRAAFIEALHLYQYFPKDRLNLHQEPMPDKTTLIPAISGAFMFLRAESFWRIDGFDEHYFLHVEDLDFCFRFKRSGGKIYFVPSIVVRHIGATSDVTNVFLEINKAKGFVRYFHENFSQNHIQPLLWALDACIMARLGIKIAPALIRDKIKQLSSRSKTPSKTKPAAPVKTKSARKK